MLAPCLREGSIAPRGCNARLLLRALLSMRLTCCVGRRCPVTFAQALWALQDPAEAAADALSALAAGDGGASEKAAEPAADGGDAPGAGAGKGAKLREFLRTLKQPPGGAPPGGAAVQGRRSRL